MIKILFFGDVVGKSGRRVIHDAIPELKDEFEPNLVIANGENAAGGLGIDPGTAKEIFDSGVDIITTGNHVWNKKDIIPVLDRESARLLRPLNYPAGAPGSGYTVCEPKSGMKLAIVNLLGRVFIPDLVDCPFRAIDDLLKQELADCRLCLVDMHAEATSEKVAMGYFLDGRVSAVLGTHTHIQTADARILPNQTAYISDVGMCGPLQSVIGVKHELIVERFRTALPVKFDVAKGTALLNAVLLTCDEESGRASKIERIWREYS